MDHHDHSFPVNGVEHSDVTRRRYLIQPTDDVLIYSVYLIQVKRTIYFS